MQPPPDAADKPNGRLERFSDSDGVFSATSTDTFPDDLYKTITIVDAIGTNALTPKSDSAAKQISDRVE